MRRNAESLGTVNRRWLRAGFWVALYLLLAAFPLLLLMFGPQPKGTGFWWDFSMGLGFAGLAMLGIQFVLTARFRRATAPFGIDIIYYFHRWAATGAVGLLIAHYAIIKAGYRESLGTANPFAAPFHMTAGRAALLIFAGLVVSSIWRKRLNIEYDRWRIWHGALAVLGIILAVMHIYGVGYYFGSPGKQAMWTIFSLLWISTLAYTRIIRPWNLWRKPYRVTSVRPERGDSWTVTVKPQGKYPCAFSPGQFAWLSLGTSPFRAKEHPFSFSSSAENQSELEFTIKELGDFTRTIKQIQPGTVAYVDGPHGVFTTDQYPGARGFCLIAGGVGMAPLMSMLRTLADRGDPRPITLIYGNSKWDSVIFREEIEALQSRLNLTVHHVLHHPPPDWTGVSGILTQSVLLPLIPAETDDLVFFVCGPPGMIDSAQRTLRAKRVPLYRIHFEHFEMV